MAKRKQTDLVQFMLRLRESLRKRLEKAAEAADVSLNAEINARLTESFEWEEMEAQHNRVIGGTAAIILSAKMWLGRAQERLAELGQRDKLTEGIEELIRILDKMNILEEAAKGFELRSPKLRSSNRTGE